MNKNKTLSEKTQLSEQSTAESQDILLAQWQTCVEMANVLVKQNCNSSPKKSSRTFLPRSKTDIERMRSDGIIPKQNIIINIRKQFSF